MPDMTGGAVKAIVTTVLAGAVTFIPGVHAHAETPAPTTVNVQAGAVTPDATAIEYGLLLAQPGSASAVQ
ncbi:hypothetical protein ACFWXK_02505 [Streptomyces sp. NPDC059070]|uniref:hypothetical protein n=1 Tax=Streptomyces sp. NPDC059070 TaxID=3346713 RepID=UPI00368A12D9